MLYYNPIKFIGLTAAVASLSLMAYNSVSTPAFASTEQATATQTTWQPSEALLKRHADAPDRRRGAGSR